MSSRTPPPKNTDALAARDGEKRKRRRGHGPGARATRKPTISDGPPPRPPKRKADDEDKGDARARRRRAREPSARTKAQDPLGAATRFVDLTRRLAAGGADASPGLELEALAKLL